MRSSSIRRYTLGIYVRKRSPRAWFENVQWPITFSHFLLLRSLQTAEQAESARNSLVSSSQRGGGVDET